MTAPKFTPGPWSEVSAQIRAASGSVVCEVFSQPADAGKRYGYGVSDANAALIAAAPELYAALLELHDYLDEHVHGLPMMVRARAALGKAGGA